MYLRGVDNLDISAGRPSKKKEKKEKKQSEIKLSMQNSKENVHVQDTFFSLFTMSWRFFLFWYNFSTFIPF